MQSLTRPGDIVLIDRNCHKSHHYGLVLAGAYPLYLDAYPLPQFAIYGAVPLRTIKQALLDLEAAGQLHRVRMLLLTNCTFDGVVYNPLQVMEEVLAIKPDICFLWDEAWYAFATAVPWARQRTAMISAERTRAEAGFAGIRRGVPGLGASRWKVSTARSGSTTGCCPTRPGPGPGVLDALHPQVAVGAAAGVDDPRPRPGLQHPEPGTRSARRS